MRGGTNLLQGQTIENRYSPSNFMSQFLCLLKKTRISDVRKITFNRLTKRYRDFCGCASLDNDKSIIIAVKTSQIPFKIIMITLKVSRLCSNLRFLEKSRRKKKTRSSSDISYRKKHFHIIYLETCKLFYELFFIATKIEKRFFPFLDEYETIAEEKVNTSSLRAFFSYNARQKRGKLKRFLTFFVGRLLILDKRQEIANEGTFLMWLAMLLNLLKKKKCLRTRSYSHPLIYCQQLWCQNGSAIKSI